MTPPQISCVIPAYEAVDLVAACLASIADQRGVDLEIILTDDSRSAAARARLGDLCAAAPNARYIAGARTGNPLENWNAGLAAARAPLVLMIHQDERLIDPHYLRRAVDLMRRPGVAAVRAGTQVTGVDRPSRFALASAMVGRLPGAARILPAINWIGPTAAFVFRAGHRFDPSLVQLADVEFYGRVLKTGALARLSGVQVASLGHHGDQITARIDPIALTRQELATLCARRPPRYGRLERLACEAALRLRSQRR